MSYTLRDYQQRAVDSALSFLYTAKRGHNGLLILPTGAGKSLVIAAIVRELDGACTVFQPSKEILEQNADKMVRYGYRPGIYSASKGRKEIRDITLGTIGSVIGNKEAFVDAPYALVDEAHWVNAEKGMYAEFFREAADTKLIGLTATPYRRTSDGYGGTQARFLTRTRAKVFHQVVHVTQNSEMVEHGYWCPLKYYRIDGFEASKVKRNSTGGDFSDRSVLQLFREIRFEEKILNIVERLLTYGRKNILVFTRFVEESEFLALRLPDQCAVVTAKTPKHERERILRRFKSGAIKVVTNVGVLANGFDYPELETVVLARPTMSLSLYYQMIGRVVRPHPDKETAFVVDMVGLRNVFGKVEDFVVRDTGNSKWIVESNGRQLTNVYYEHLFYPRRHSFRRWQPAKPAPRRGVSLDEDV
jgi:DNA repair protein RadD